MKRMRFFAVALALLLVLPAAAFCRTVEPIVSTDWLEQNLANPKVIVVDIRKVEEYKAGHIPGALSIFYGTWVVKAGEMDNQLPPDDELVDILSGAGIGPESIVVVVGRMDTPPDRVGITRVAWTLKYAGVDNVAILNGAHAKWAGEKRALSPEPVKAKAMPYKGKFDKSVLAGKDYVMSRLGKATIVDVREPDFYAGKQKLPFVARAGRIPGALNLPTSLTFVKPPEGQECCWLFKDKQALASAAAPVVGDDPAKEIIVYCDTGKVCSAWWYALREVLGYKDVKNYDGSTQEWMKDPGAPVVP